MLTHGLISRSNLKFHHILEQFVMCTMGKLIESFVFLSQPANVSLLLNTDGVSLFHSSTVTLWPIRLAINELPFKEMVGDSGIDIQVCYKFV